MVTQRFVIGDSEVDLERGEAHGASGTVPLTANEVRVLAVLAAHPGEAVDRDVLLCEALGYKRAVQSRAIDQAIWRLRRKLEPEPHCPRWLLSEASTGYRLILDAPSSSRVVGRTSEVARLLSLLEAHDRVVLVGLPGSGRRTVLMEAVSEGGLVVVGKVSPEGPRATVTLRREGASRTVVLDVVMPTDARVPAVRLGPLDPVHGRALLIREVLAVRAASRLTDDEEADAALAAARVGHHPASLQAVAKAALFEPLGRVVIAPLPAIVAHVEGLPDDARRVLMACAVFPGEFTAEEAEITQDALTLGWRAGVLDFVGREGERALAVPRCVRQVVEAELVGSKAAKPFVERLTTELRPYALRSVTHLDGDAMHLVRQKRERINVAFDVSDEPDRIALLPLLHSLASVGGGFPSVLPAVPDASPDLRVHAHLLRALALEGTDVDGSLAEAEAACEIEASPLLMAAALRVVCRLHLHAGHPASTFAAAVAALEALADRTRDQDDVGVLVAGSLAYCRGNQGIRAGEPDRAREELVAALGCFGPSSTAARMLASSLAAEAARDGRVQEALAWSDRVNASDLPASEEARERLRHSSILTLCGDTAAAKRELDLVELLGGAEHALLLERAILKLMARKVNKAVVLAKNAIILPGRPGAVRFGEHMVLGWARVAQGLGDLALTEVIRVTAPVSHADYRAQLGLLEAAAHAVNGSPADARRVLDAIEPVPWRWWPPTERIVRAFVTDAGADADALEADLDRGGRVHLIARFALVAQRTRALR